MVNFLYKYIKIKICMTITKKTNLMKNKFYLLFARLKKTYVTNELKCPCEIVDNSV